LELLCSSRMLQDWPPPSRQARTPGSWPVPISPRPRELSKRSLRCRQVGKLTLERGNARAAAIG